MSPALRSLVLSAACALALAACSSGSTTVSGVSGDGPAATGPVTGPTAATAPTGPSGATSVTGTAGEFEGAVSLDIPSGRNPTGAAVYSCEGIEGPWTYEPGELALQGIKMEITAAPFDMEGGTGTLVIEGTITIPGAGDAGFVDTVKLEIAGPADAPEMTSTGVKVDASGVLEGIPFDFADFFPENASFPVVAGASQC